MIILNITQNENLCFSGLKEKREDPDTVLYAGNFVDTASLGISDEKVQKNTEVQIYVRDKKIKLLNEYNQIFQSQTEIKKVESQKVVDKPKVNTESDDQPQTESKELLEEKKRQFVRKTEDDHTIQPMSDEEKEKDFKAKQEEMIKNSQKLNYEKQKQEKLAEISASFQLSSLEDMWHDKNEDPDIRKAARDKYFDLTNGSDIMKNDELDDIPSNPSVI